MAALFEGANISIRRTRAPIERTEGTNYVANIRVINVAVDDVGDDIVGVFLLSNFICGRANAGHVVRFEERGAIVSGEPRTGEGPVQNVLNLTRHVLSLLVSYPISKMNLCGVRSLDRKSTRLNSSHVRIS